MRNLLVLVLLATCWPVPARADKKAIVALTLTDLVLVDTTENVVLRVQ
jgi:hypothetical protein